VHFPDVEPADYAQEYPGVYGVPAGVIECVVLQNRPATVNVIFSYGTNAPT